MSYRAAWKETGRAGPMPKFGLGRMLVVADTDAEALRLAERAYPVWYDSFNHLFKVYGRMPTHPRPPTFSAIIADGRGICGSPRTVTEIIRQQMAESGADYFVGQFAFGDLTLAGNAALHRAVRRARSCRRCAATEFQRGNASPRERPARPDASS